MCRLGGLRGGIRLWRCGMSEVRMAVRCRRKTRTVWILKLGFVGVWPHKNAGWQPALRVLAAAALIRGRSNADDAGSRYASGNSSHFRTRYSGGRSKPAPLREEFKCDGKEPAETPAVLVSGNCLAELRRGSLCLWTLVTPCRRGSI